MFNKHRINQDYSYLDVSDEYLFDTLRDDEYDEDEDEDEVEDGDSDEDYDLLVVRSLRNPPFPLSFL